MLMTVLVTATVLPTLVNVYDCLISPLCLIL